MTARSFLFDLVAFPIRPEGLANGEAGQARLRLVGGVAVLCAYLLAHWSQAFGNLREGITAVAVFAAYAYAWGWVVAVNAFGETARRAGVIVLDEGIFCWGLWYAGGQFSILVWLPIFMTVGNGLRYGTRWAYFSASTATFFVATAFVCSDFWREINHGVAVGIAIGGFVIPTYAVSLNLKLRRQQRETELRAAKFEQANRTDLLTNISNRLGFERALTRLVDDSRESAGSGAVLYLDLDGFKACNDMAGHAAGDEVLRAVAEKLRNAVRSTDLVARLGGDEFAIVARGLVSGQDALALAATMKAAIATIRVPGFDQLRVGVTTGICLLPHPLITSAAEATRMADELMLEGKRIQRGSVRIAAEFDDGGARSGATARHAPAGAS